MEEEQGETGDEAIQDSEEDNKFNEMHLFKFKSLIQWYSGTLKEAVTEERTLVFVSETDNEEEEKSGP